MLGALIGGALALGGALLSGNSAKKAANKAADAQIQVAQQNNALLRELYGRNEANFQPYFQQGNRATSVLNGLLYGDQAQQAPQQAYGGENPLYGAPGGSTGYSGGDGGRFFYDGGHDVSDFSGGGPYMPLYGDTGMPQGPVTTQGPSGQNAWDTFRNSTNYQFRLGEGQNALNQGWAGQGAYRSGAAMKDALRYNQNFASNELGNYINLLQGQQNLGFGSAQALAGVSNNYGNNVTAQNSNAADAVSNAALLRGQANSNMWGGIAGGIGNLLGSFGSSFKGF